MLFAILIKLNPEEIVLELIRSAKSEDFWYIKIGIWYTNLVYEIGSLEDFRPSPHITLYDLKSCAHHK